MSSAQPTRPPEAPTLPPPPPSPSLSPAPAPPPPPTAAIDAAPRAPLPAEAILPPTLPPPPPSPGSPNSPEPPALAPPTPPADDPSVQSGSAADATPATGSSGPRRSAFLTAIVAAAVLGGAAAWWGLGPTGNEQAGADPIAEQDPRPGDIEANQTDPTDAAPAPDSATSANPPIGQIAVDAMDDAGSVVDQINDRSAEEELLAELGLDETGDPLTVGAKLAGHRFTWVLLDGTTATVTVALDSGDHSYDDDRGLSFRLIGDEAFGRPSADDSWTTIDPAQLPEIERLGLAGPISVAELLGAAADFATEGSTGVAADGSLATAWTIDDAAFHQARPTERATWLDVIGLPASDPSGDLDVSINLTPDGLFVSSADIERASTGETVSYRLDEIFDTAPTIAAPQQ